MYVGVPGRDALIALKLFAAMDRGPASVHMQDLLRMHPADDELAGAAAWVATQDASDFFQAELPLMVDYVRDHRDHAR